MALRLEAQAVPVAPQLVAAAVVAVSSDAASCTSDSARLLYATPPRRCSCGRETVPSLQAAGLGLLELVLVVLLVVLVLLMGSFPTWILGLGARCV